MTTHRWIRASDQDRESVAEVLRDAYAAGCLDSGELEQRTGVAYSARTLGELYDLTGDLPEWLMQPPAPLPDQYCHRRAPVTRWRTATWLFGVMLVTNVAWVIVAAMARWPLAVVPLILLSLFALSSRDR